MRVLCCRWHVCDDVSFSGSRIRNPNRYIVTHFKYRFMRHIRDRLCRIHYRQFGLLRLRLRYSRRTLFFRCRILSCPITSYRLYYIAIVFNVPVQGDILASFLFFFHFVHARRFFFVHLKYVSDSDSFVYSACRCNCVFRLEFVYWIRLARYEDYGF